MARDARRTKSVTFTEGQTKWIEDQIAAGMPDSGAVIKLAIDRAMTPETTKLNVVPSPVKPEPPRPAADAFVSKSLCEISATLDILLKKYMADHPSKKLTPKEESDLLSRWDTVVALRSEDGGD